MIGRHAPDLLRAARGLCRSGGDAEDLVQETLIEAYKGIGKFDGRASLRTWMSRILLRRAGRMWRKRYRRGGDVTLESAMEASRPDEALVVAGQMREVEHRVDLAGILETLAPEHREVLVLREIQGLAYGEIAQMLRVPQGTVESRLHRARSALRERLKGYGS
ncbi:MAG TPA: sigma-70 family RNA polymerase sigma factor [Tepidisphaeraceae bacterium]|nr:sigma-70 family RNA polymerase sigma factor [Tepidisphaeraceae bacterium]